MRLVLEGEVAGEGVRERIVGGAGGRKGRPKWFRRVAAGLAKDKEREHAIRDGDYTLTGFLGNGTVTVAFEGEEFTAKGEVEGGEEVEITGCVVEHRAKCKAKVGEEEVRRRRGERSEYRPFDLPSSQLSALSCIIALLTPRFARRFLVVSSTSSAATAGTSSATRGRSG